jgi:hypothetical protein
MENRAENMKRKRPYSTPSLVLQSLSGLATGIRKREAEDGRPIEIWLLWPGTQSPLMIVEGFEGDTANLFQVLSSIGWPLQSNAQLAGGGMPEILREKSQGTVPAEICLLLVDMRRRCSEYHRRLIRIETKSNSSGTVTLILTDSGEDFIAGREILRTDRWHLSGLITPSGLGVLVKSVIQIWTAQMETPVKPSSTSKMNSPTASAIAYAERE